MAVPELLSQSSITIGSDSFLNVQKLLWSLHMWCDAPESMTHFGAAAVRLHVVSQEAMQSPVGARAAVAVAFFILHHSFIHL
jgi:hypothetical protein